MEKIEAIKAVFAALFNARSGPAGALPKLNFYVTPSVFDAFFQVHTATAMLLPKFKAVLEDGEHELLISEGRRRGFRMPNVERYKYILPAFQAHLQSYNPQDIRKTGGHYDVPLQTARGFYITSLIASAMMADLLHDLNTLDYWKMTRTLRNDGFPYQGAVCLGHILALHMSLHGAAQIVVNENLSKKMPINWMAGPE